MKLENGHLETGQQRFVAMPSVLPGAFVMRECWCSKHAGEDGRTLLFPDFRTVQVAPRGAPAIHNKSFQAACRHAVTFWSPCFCSLHACKDSWPHQLSQLPPSSLQGGGPKR